MVSQRTKDVIKKRNIFFIISLILWIGTAVFMVFSALGNVATNSDSAALIEMTDAGKTLVYSISTTAIVGIIAAIIIKDKVRTAMWMASTVLSAIFYGNVGMYIVLFLWLIDEYVIFGLYNFYKSKVSINKEIDLRE